MIDFNKVSFVNDVSVLIDDNYDEWLVMECREESCILCKINVDYYEEIEVLNCDFCEDGSKWILK